MSRKVDCYLGIVVMIERRFSSLFAAFAENGEPGAHKSQKVKQDSHF
jgi:hypothetical protein